MIIGIDASRAFIKERTGIEEYSYQVIKHLRDELVSGQVVLYVRSDQKVDFELPSNWIVKKLWLPRLWTQFRLSWELWRHPVNVLFIPAHTVPWYHPEKTVVAVHGLEYEFCPDGYSMWERWYMRRAIKNSCDWASKIICVSQNTKKDLVALYKVPENKIEVIYNGYVDDFQVLSPNLRQNLKLQISKNIPYFLYLGRIEKRKNVLSVVRAFEILKEKYDIPHRLVLAGKGGYGYEEIKNKINISVYVSDIVLAGFVSERRKWELINGAEIFLFPSSYEGFGLPVLEAQSAGVPVITSSVSSLPEVARGGAILVDPNDSDQMAEKIFLLTRGKNLRGGIIQKGRENLKRFSWGKCAKEIGVLLCS